MVLLKTKKVLKSLLLVSLLISIYFDSTGQGIDIFKEDQRLNDVSGNMCAVLDYNDLEINGMKVYEEANNLHTPKSTMLHYAKKDYRYRLELYIKKEDGKPLVDLYSCGDGNYCVYFEIHPKRVDKNISYDHIKYNSNPDVRMDNIQPLCNLGYQLYFQGEEIYRNYNTAGKSFDRNIIIDTELDSLTAHNLQRHLLNGRALKLNYVKYVKLTSKATFSHNLEIYQESYAYREFISPVEGKQITVAQKMFIENALKTYMRTEIIIDKNSGVTFDQFIDMFFGLLFVDNAKNLVSFEELATSRLVDFNGKRYATDEIEHLALNTRNMSDKSWEKEHKKIYDNLYLKDNNTETDVTSNINILGIFDLDFSFDREKKRYLKKHLKDTIEDKDKARDIIENSFDYEFDGTQYIPKSIIGNEVVNITNNKEFKKLFEVISIDQDIRSTELIIR